MKKIFLIFPFFISAFFIQAQHYTCVKTSVFDLEDIQKVQLLLENTDIEVEIKTTKSSRAIVQTFVHIENNNANFLSFLSKQGRYDFTPIENKQEESLQLKPRKNHNVLIFKGQKLKEKIKYLMYLPQGVGLES